MNLQSLELLKNTKTENTNPQMRRVFGIILQIYSRKAKCNRLLILYCYSICEIIVISGIEFSKLDTVWETALEHHKLDV